MATGVVKWFNSDRGLGFIQNEQGKDVFVHYKDVEGFRHLRRGQKVSYQEAGPKNTPRGIKVQLISG